METNKFRPELHVAQQSRRDKLRVQHHSNPDQNVEVHTNHLEHFTVHGGLNPDLVQFRGSKHGNLSYEAAVFSSEMLNFAPNSQALSAHKDVLMVHQEATTASPDKRMSAEDATFANSSDAIPSNLNSSPKGSGEPQNCSTWKSIGSQESCDLVTNYTSGSAAMASNSNPIFVTEGLSGCLRANIPSASMFYLKPNCHGYQGMMSSLTAPCCELHRSNIQKPYEDVHFNCPSLYHNSFQDVTTTTIVAQELGMASLAEDNSRQTGRVSWLNNGNELLLLPAYADGCHQWSGDLDFCENKNPTRELRTIANDNSTTQALSLSLSSVPLSEQHACRAGEGIVSEDLHSGGSCFNNMADDKTLKSDYLSPNATVAHRGAGPLGPFTGYATILKSSKFLRPAQQLLDEFCDGARPKPLKILEAPDKVSSGIRSANGTVNAAGAIAGDSGGSSSAFYSSNETTLEAGGLSSPNETCRPEYLQMKAKLLYMQEEVCRRYKHFHQQMQMVVLSFESVAGLSAATPYISLALKTLSKYFRCLRNAIYNQLKNVRKALGEDLSSLTTGTSCTKVDTSSSRLKLIDQTFAKQKAVGGNLGFFEPQQHVWRPQRGLPERAVAVLRAWLFDHFLHPYPTDAEKHMLATQTGLTRSQVSNWFINARVRVWKPMVEEIHTLETKGKAETGSSAINVRGKTPTEVGSGSNDSKLLNRLSASGLSDKQAECSEISSSAFTAGNRMNADAWNQEKRARLECGITASMDGTLVGFVPYQENGIEIGGLGSVSLTLGLRQNADGAQQQQHENQLRRHFGDQIIYDFVG